MYRPRSHIGDIGDVEIIEHEGRLHMFHLVIPNRDLIAHAVSDDGLAWKALPPAIRTGDPGDWDDDMIRTVSVTPCDGRFMMLYCASCRQDGGRIERMCGAVSDDLLTWEKLGEVAGIEPTEAIYESTAQTPARVSWRDPKPLYHDGLYYCVLCAREKDGATLRRGTVALLTSPDMLHWTERQPLFAPKSCLEIECPQVYEIGGAYYLIGSLMEDSSQRYWRSEHIDGPYTVADGENLMLPPRTHYAGRLTRFQGRDVFACWTFAMEDGPSPFGLMESPGALIKYVPAVLEVRVDATGALTLHSPAAWNHYQCGETHPILGTGKKPLYQNPFASMEGNALCVPSGMEVVADDAIHTDFTLNCRIAATGYCAGLTFHADEDGAGYFVEFYPKTNRVRLLRNHPSMTHNGFVWFDWKTLSETYVDLRQLPSGLAVQLRAVNGEIEISIDGRLVISTVSTRGRQGKVGLFADNADIELLESAIVAMRVPDNR